LLNELIENLSIKVPNNLYRPEVFLKALLLKNQNLFEAVSKVIEKITVKYKDYIQSITNNNKTHPCLKDIDNFETLIEVYGFIEKEEYKKALEVILSI